MIIPAIFVNKETADPIKVKAPLSEAFLDSLMIPFFKIGPKTKPTATINKVVPIRINHSMSDAPFLKKNRQNYSAGSLNACSRRSIPI